MTLDARFRSLARRLTSQYGKAVTMRKVSSTFDPATGTTTETTADYPTTSAPPAPYRQDHIDGNLVQAGDMQLLVPAIDLAKEPEFGFKPLDIDEETIDTKWKVVMDGEEWSVVSVEWLWSGEQVAAYQVQVRR